MLGTRSRATLSGINSIFLLATAFITRCYADGNIAPSNASIPVSGLLSSSSNVTLSVSHGSADSSSIQVLHLTANGTPIPNAGISGPLFLATPQNQSQQTIQTISFISCDPVDYEGVIGSLPISPLDIATNVEQQNPGNAVVLYSRTSTWCSPQSSMSILWPLVFTMLSASDSSALVSQIKNAGSTPLNGTLGGPNPSSTSGARPNASTTNDQPPMQGTAVAMIVLYAITGLVTALFVFIIVTGAIRARRHPERYGPRTQPGRRRQTRAGGLARAMLETIPIVKFGEQDGAKSGDVEMTATSAADHSPASSVAEKTTASSNVKSPDDVPASVTAEEGGISAAGPANTDLHQEKDNNHGCSICTDDFEVGQDQRILPCSHAFHPACIDPWLLNVSGTCPLCRVDLRPRQSAEIESETQDGENALQRPATTEETDHRNDRRRRSFLAFTGLAGADSMTPAERTAALRRYRMFVRTRNRASIVSNGSAAISPVNEESEPAPELNSATRSTQTAAQPGQSESTVRHHLGRLFARGPASEQSQAAPR